MAGAGSATQSVIVVGAGIAGLSAARALQRAGIEVSIYERATELSKVQIGGGFHLWTNAMRALRELGLDQDAIAIGSPIERTEYRTYDGDLLAMWPVGEIAADHGIPDIGVNRRDLHRMLVEAVPEGTINLGKELEDFTEEGDGVHVRFKDGAEARASALLGADGLRSRVRAKLLGDEPPRSAGYTQWQTTIGGADDLLQPRAEQVIFGPGSRAILHYVGGGELFWAGVLYGPLNAAEQRADRKARLLAHFLDWRGSIAAAISRTPEEQIVGIDIYDRPAVKEWGRGRVTLAGDAAHPMTTNLSQGGCQALEDAVVLARHLREGRDVSAALRAYESERIPRTTALVKRSRRVSTLGSWERPAAMAARSKILGKVLSGPGLKDHRKFVAAPL